MRRLLNQLMPFIIAGIALIVIGFGIMLLVYLLIFGALLGFVLYVFNLIRNKFFPPKNLHKPEPKKTGRIIDSDDWKEL